MRMPTHQNGFTLVELIIVIVILGILVVVTEPLLQSGFDAYFTQRNITEANWQESLALSRMKRDIRGMPTLANITMATSSELAFTDSENESVDYTLSGTNLLRNTDVLASGVNSISFAYYNRYGATTTTLSDIRYINITLNVTKNNVDYTTFTTIFVRNAE